MGTLGVQVKNLAVKILDKVMFRNEGAVASKKREVLKVYPVLPHGELKEVLSNIWFVTGQVKMPMLFPPMKGSRSMTVIKNPANGELTLINSIRLNEEGLKHLEKIGKVAHILRIAAFHGRDDAFYRERYGAKVYALKGQVYTREMMNPPTDPDFGFMQPDVWLREGDLPPVPNGKLKWFISCTVPESILVLKQDGGVLVAGDSLQNSASADQYHNWAAKLMMGKFGFFKPFNVGPGWIQFGKPKLSDVRSILDLEFEHVLPGHGAAVIGGAKEKFRPILEGEIKGCHA